MQNLQRQDTQTDSFQTLKPLSELIGLGLTLIGNSEILETGQRQGVTVTRTGKPLSETTLTELRIAAINVKRGSLLDDKTLETLLVQHFGQQRLCVKKDTDHRYSDEGYECVTNGYTIVLDFLADCEMKLFDALDFINRPASEAFCGAKLAQLRAVMARGKESNNDIEIVISTYAEHVSQFPPDVVAYVVDRCIATKKWFPLVSELIKEMNELVMFRRSVLSAFEDCRNPLKARNVKMIKQIREPEPVYFSDPRDNPIRRILCDFLVSKGQDDHFENTRLFTNYQLEMFANSLGFENQAAVVCDNGLPF